MLIKKNLSINQASVFPKAFLVPPSQRQKIRSLGSWNLENRTENTSWFSWRSHGFAFMSFFTCFPFVMCDRIDLGRNWFLYLFTQKVWSNRQFFQVIARIWRVNALRRSPCQLCGVRKANLPCPVKSFCLRSSQEAKHLTNLPWWRLFRGVRCVVHVVAGLLIRA